MFRNKVVWDKHYYSNRFTVRNIFLLRYSRFRLMCTFKFYAEWKSVRLEHFTSIVYYNNFTLLRTTSLRKTLLHETYIFNKHLIH